MDTGRLEMVGKVARCDAHGVGVAFLTFSRSEAERIAPFVAPGDIRQWSRRIPVNLPVRIEAGADDQGVMHGRTVDLSTLGGRITTDGQLAAADVVVLELPGPEVGATLRLPAVVWQAYAGGAVLVFANLARSEHERLRNFLGHFEDPREQAALREEIGTLRAEAERHRTLAEGVERERDELRNEVTALRAETDRLRTEQAEAGETASKLLVEMKELVNQVAHKFQGPFRTSPFARDPRTPHS